MRAYLILEDGNIFEGTHIGADREVIKIGRASCRERV